MYDVIRIGNFKYNFIHEHDLINLNYVQYVRNVAQLPEKLLEKFLREKPCFKIKLVPYWNIVCRNIWYKCDALYDLETLLQIKKPEKHP